MTGIYRWLGISSGAIHSHWTHHLYAMAAINGLCLLIHLMVTCLMRRRINRTTTQERVCTSSSSCHSSDSEEDNAGNRKGVLLKVRYNKSSSSRAKISTTRRSRRNRSRIREEDGKGTCTVPMVVRKTVPPMDLMEERPEEYRPSAPTYQPPKSPVYFS